MLNATRETVQVRRDKSSIDIPIRAKLACLIPPPFPLHVLCSKENQTSLNFYYSVTPYVTSLNLVLNHQINEYLFVREKFEYLLIQSWFFFSISQMGEFGGQNAHSTLNTDCESGV